MKDLFNQTPAETPDINARISRAYETYRKAVFEKSPMIKDDFNFFKLMLRQPGAYITVEQLKFFNHLHICDFMELGIRLDPKIVDQDHFTRKDGAWKKNLNFWRAAQRIADSEHAEYAAKFFDKIQSLDELKQHEENASQSTLNDGYIRQYELFWAAIGARRLSKVIEIYDAVGETFPIAFLNDVKGKHKVSPLYALLFSDEKDLIEKLMIPERWVGQAKVLRDMYDEKLPLYYKSKVGAKPLFTNKIHHLTMAENEPPVGIRRRPSGL